MDPVEGIESRYFEIVVARPQGRQANTADTRRNSWGGMRFMPRTAPAPGPLAKLRGQLKSHDIQRLGLTESAREMLSGLPPHLSTAELQRNHPDVLNEMAALRRRPRDLERRADERLYQARGHDPLNMAAVVELCELKDHLLRTGEHWRPSVWDEAYGLGGGPR